MNLINSNMKIMNLTNIIFDVTIEFRRRQAGPAEIQKLKKRGYESNEKQKYRMDRSVL